MLVNIRKKRAGEYQYIVVLLNNNNMKLMMSTNDIFALNAKKVHGSVPDTLLLVKSVGGW